MKIHYLGDSNSFKRRLKSLAWIACVLLILPMLSRNEFTTACAQSSKNSHGLPLGGSALPENRARKVLAPGVTLTTITRGIASKGEHWTLLIMMSDPAASPSVIAARDQAQQTAAKLTDAGLAPKIREERNPEYKDLPAGILGYSVRIGTYVSKDAAKADTDKLSALGYRTSLWFTGEDDEQTSGPWTVRVLTIDPHVFHGEINATHGSSIGNRTKLSVLAQQAGALAAVNGGFFVVFPSDGIPGDPAGVFVDHGKLLSEATNGRIAMGMFNRNKPNGETFVRFLNLTTTMRLVVGKDLVHSVDGINRKPGVIRDCGGAGDTPTNLPRHDFTCTDPDELVAITPEFGASAPAGDGIEAVVDKAGIVIELRDRTGGSVPQGGMLIQGIGTEAAWLKSNAPVGTSLRLESKITDAAGKEVVLDSNDSAINGGPGLVVHGKVEIRPAADGLVHPEDPSFLLRWGVRRNPRTMVGVDRQKRIFLVSVDGHQPGYSLGLSLVEGARLMIGLGAVEAMNIDGGGSTAMAINGELVGKPSDPTGERPVGDAVIVK